MSDHTELHNITEQTLHRIAGKDITSRERVAEAYRLLSHFVISIAEKEQLHFSTLFSRIAFLSSKFALPPDLTRFLHIFRIESERLLRRSPNEDSETVEDIWNLGAYALLKTSEHITGCDLTPESSSLFQFPAAHVRELPVPHKFDRHVRVVVTRSDPGASILYCTRADDGSAARINYSDPGRSDVYSQQILEAIDLLGFPLTLSLIDCETHHSDILSPRMIVIEPDYLVDVTAIAECFREDGADSRLYLLGKFRPKEVTVPLLIGNIVNYFLDELVHDRDADFNTLMPRAFKLNPTAFSTLPDEKVRELSKKAESHFENLQRSVRQDFEQLGIDPASAYIEPSFYAPAFGIQGRLDLYHTVGENRADIVELKSARPFKPNAYGLSSTHYTQTLLYDLMIRAVRSFRMKPSAYILYSSQITHALRYAPPVYALQREAIRLRNDIFLTERRIQIGEHAPVVALIKPENFPHAGGFIAKNITDFHKTLTALDETELSYFLAFTSFVASEHHLAKVGIHGSERSRGLAGLWLQPIDEKEEQYEIMQDLSISGMDQLSDRGVIELVKGENTNPLANFRTGDIAVLYPDADPHPPALHHQIFKCTIIYHDTGMIVLRLRNKQVNPDYLQKHDRWIIEHDVLDSSFDAMHRGLYAFSGFSGNRRDLFLGRRPPATPDNITPKISGLPDTVRDIVQRIISAKEYFLLWGPPGTGKTRVVLHHLVRYYLEQTRERILLMAYTNRAVDEICESIDAIGGKVRDQYLRIGSRVATREEFRDQLLISRIADISNRRDLVNLMRQQRIIVSTVSSIAGRQELFDILQVDTVIVDEASQILEPMLAGLLPRFEKNILIGDHKQLPAVVTQSVRQSKIDKPELLEIGLTDRRTSYFERMFLRCLDKGWNWATGQLLEQGRMHQEIMKFPGEIFYAGTLQVLPAKYLPNRDLTAPMKIPVTAGVSDIQRVLASRRMVYIPSQSNPLSGWSKTHHDEAAICTMVVQALEVLFSDMENQPSIGIITPFRAQIANIRDHFVHAGIDPARYTIDTVERYQGSARDIIILSLSVHHPSQMESVTSLSSDGVDRKLNVALTRAREQFIITASAEVVRHNDLYQQLTEMCYRFEVEPAAQRL